MKYVRILILVGVAVVFSVGVLGQILVSILNMYVINNGHKVINNDILVELIGIVVLNVLCAIGGYFIAISKNRNRFLWAIICFFSSLWGFMYLYKNKL